MAVQNLLHPLSYLFAPVPAHQIKTALAPTLIFSIDFPQSYLKYFHNSPPFVTPNVFLISHLWFIFIQPHYRDIIVFIKGSTLNPCVMKTFALIPSVLNNYIWRERQLAC